MFPSIIKKAPCATTIRALLVPALMLVLTSAGTSESKLAAALHGALGKSSDDTTGVSEITEWMAPPFHALPKLGQTQRLGPRAARHLLQSYFNANLGWDIKGLKPNGMQKDTTVKGLEELSVIKAKAPKIGKLLSKFEPATNGLSLEELAATAAVVKKLIVRESKAAMKAAWKLHNHSFGDELTWQQMHEVIRSSLLLINDWNANILGENELKFGIDPILHEYFGNLLEKAKNRSDSWQSLEDFVASVTSKVLQSYSMSSGSSKSESYSYRTVKKAFEHAFVEYGQFQNTDCVEMKEQLRGMDPSGSGRVSLKAFYSAPENAKYHFTETPKHLHKYGLLDNTNRQAPSVLATNYVDSETNCLRAAPHFSLCCISECTSLMMKLEAALETSTGSPATLLSIVANLTGNEAGKSRAMLPELVEKLNEIGQLNGGEVPLHGQLFAQWLHYVEPYKCTYPTTVITQANWYELKALVTDEERASYAASLSDATHSPASADSSLIITQWNYEENLFFQDSSIQDAKEHAVPAEMPPNSPRSFLRLAFLVAAIISSLSVLGCLARKALQAYRHKQCEKDLLMDENNSTTGNKAVAATRGTKGKSQQRKKVSPGQLSSVKRYSRSGQSEAKEIPNELDDASLISPACDNEVSSLDEMSGEVDTKGEAAIAAIATAPNTETTPVLKAEPTGPEVAITPGVEVINQGEDEAASADHDVMDCVADDTAGEHQIGGPVMFEVAGSPMPVTVMEGFEHPKVDKAAAAIDASARAVAARAAAAEAAAAAAAAAQSAAVAAAEADALAAEAAKAADAAASEGLTLPGFQAETKQPQLSSVPSGFEVFERVGLLVPKSKAPSLPGDQPLPPSFRPPPGLEMLPPPPGLEMMPPPGLGL